MMPLNEQIRELNRTVSELQLKQRLKRIFQGIMIYLSIAGLVTFSMFILEEAFQTTMFGTWPAQDARDWQLVAEGCELMESINGTLKIVNWTAGWVQPLAFLAYGSYAKSADYYIRALRAKAFANAPQAFDGDFMRFNFQPQSVKRINGQAYAINGAVHVPIAEGIDWQGVREVAGVVTVVDNLVMIQPEG